MDELVFAARPWDTRDIGLFYASGSGLAFPF